MSGTSQVVAAVVAAGMMAFIIRMVRTGQVRVKYSLLWLLVGSGMVVLAASPSLLDTVSHSLGISYGPATLFLSAILLLLLVAMHYSWELSRLEERTRVLAEEIAILKAGQPSAQTALPTELEAEAPYGRSEPEPDALPATRRRRSPAVR